MSYLIVFDVETTGLSKENDEILKLSIIDGDYNVLFDSFIKPSKVNSWEDAERIHGITPDMVKDAPFFEEVKDKVQEIFNDASVMVAYNGDFDIGFLSNVGIRIPNIKYHDVMYEFAPIYGEYSNYHQNFKWQRLEKAAWCYGYEFKAHDSLEDVKATLFVFYKMREGLCPN